MEPCGTPHVIIVSLDMVQFISVTCVLLVKYDLNHSTVLVSEPIGRSLLSKISWLTVSNAFWLRLGLGLGSVRVSLGLG